ncbi:hypothetical protein [Thalassomonas haliotis]|uniref:Bacteriophage tail tape measure N-terminal domain-containing protein n=1 Tax=Thalassomonas haliotis TaxID=485448 RepID=A0ABY7VCF6_9GAMM|nr:hypothetical protein [Thalassomonas haliotis]WDE11343.1 hypothetical protein H3N35_24495 [Thalassomonas haliotis]
MAIQLVQGARAVMLADSAIDPQLGAAEKAAAQEAALRKILLDKVKSGNKALLSAAEAQKQRVLELQAIIEATNYSTGVTAKHVDEQIKSVALNTKATRETATAAAKVLLTGKAVRKESFDKILAASQDLTVLSGDIVSNAKMLAEAQAEPLKGLKNLQKAKVQFTPEEIKNITLLEKEGKRDQAGDAILNAVNQRVGGKAQQLDSGFSGAMDKLSDHWTDWKISIDDFFSYDEALTSAANGIVSAIDSFIAADDISPQKQLEALQAEKVKIEQQLAAVNSQPGNRVGSLLVGPDIALQGRLSSLDEEIIATQKVIGEEEKARQGSEAAEKARHQRRLEARQKAGEKKLDVVRKELATEQELIQEATDKQIKIIRSAEVSQSYANKNGFANGEGLKTVYAEELQYRADQKKAAIGVKPESGGLTGTAQACACENPQSQPCCQQAPVTAIDPAMPQTMPMVGAAAIGADQATSEINPEEQASLFAMQQEQKLASLQLAQEQEMEQMFAHSEIMKQFKEGIISEEQAAELQRRDEQLLRMQENFDQQMILLGDNEIAKAELQTQFRADNELAVTESEQRMTAIKQAEEEAKLKSGVDGMLGNLQALASTGKKGAQIAKAAAIGQATIKTYESANNAYSSLAGIPIIGPALGVAAAAAAIAAGMANVAQIKSQPISGARALGGPVGNGQTYLVGENGPELFTPGASGQITSNDNLHKALNEEADMSAGSATVQNTDVNINITAPDRDSVVEALMAERDLITSMVQMALADQGRDL